MGIELTIFTLLSIYLSGISMQDMRRREISNFAPVVLIMASPFVTEITFTERFLGLLAVFVPLLAVNLFTNGFGMGDVKLCAAFGFALGAITEFIALALALTAAVIVGRITKNNTLPLAPFLCSAGMATIFMEVIFKC